MHIDEKGVKRLYSKIRLGKIDVLLRYYLEGKEKGEDTVKYFIIVTSLTIEDDELSKRLFPIQLDLKEREKEAL